MKLFYLSLIVFGMLGCSTSSPQEERLQPAPALDSRVPDPYSPDDTVTKEIPIDILSANYLRRWEFGIQISDEEVRREKEIIAHLRTRATEELQRCRSNDFADISILPLVIQWDVFSPEELRSTRAEMDTLLHAERVHRAKELVRTIPRLLHYGPDDQTIYQAIMGLKKLLDQGVTLEEINLSQEWWSAWLAQSKSIIDRRDTLAKQGEEERVAKYRTERRERIKQSMKTAK